MNLVQSLFFFSGLSFDDLFKNASSEDVPSPVSNFDFFGLTSETTSNITASSSVELSGFINELTPTPIVQSSCSSSHGNLTLI